MAHFGNNLLHFALSLGKKELSLSIHFVRGAEDMSGRYSRPQNTLAWQ